jgi:HEAT repeat protein
LARLRKDSQGEIRRAAYLWSGLKPIPMKDLRPGLEDPDPRVREAAYEACCDGAQTLEELRHLLSVVQASAQVAKRAKLASDPENVAAQTQIYNLKYRVRIQEGFLRDAFGRLNGLGAAEVLRLLDSSDVENRRLGTYLACVLTGPQIFAALERRVKDEDPSVRRCLAEEATHLPAATARTIFTRLLDDPEIDVWGRAAKALKGQKASDR